MALGVAAGLLLFCILRGYNLWPLLFLGGLLYVLSRAVGLSGGAFSQRATVGAAAGATGVTFSDIGGQEPAKRELREALDFLKCARRVRQLGIRPIRGILLTGPPGTGKTMLAKAAATHTDSVFVSASGSEFVEVYAGVGAQRVRSLFQRARELARARGKNSAIVFIDELEVLGGKRGRHSSHLEYDQTLNQLLVEMDGLGPDDEIRILVIGATNRADLLDEALLRPGRFDRILQVPLPDREGRLSILKLHTRDKPLDCDVDLAEIAGETFGFSGAHLEMVANEAAILALRAGRDRISQQHFREAVEKVLMGEKSDRVPTREELLRVAVHEAGHALVSELLRPGSVSAVAVSPRGASLGYVRHRRDRDRRLFCPQEIGVEIAALLGGAVAEELVCGTRSTGAADDFDQAARLARRLVLSGLSPLGIVDAESIPRDVMFSTVREVLATEEKRVRQLLEGRRRLLVHVSEQLAQKERLSGDELRQMLQEAEETAHRD